MSETPNSAESEVRDKVEAIVTEGRDVRGRVTALVAEASHAAQQSGEGLLALARSVVDAATQSLNKGISSVPADGTLRQVIDGVGDGLSRAAMSAKMAVEEARAQGKQFAAEDLHKIKDDLTSLTSLYVQTVSDAASKTKSEASAGLSSLLEHAEQARDRMLPAVKSAIDAVIQDPKGMGKESLQAGLAASQYATGTLFSTMGRFLQEAGRRLTSEGKDVGGK